MGVKTKSCHTAYFIAWTVATIGIKFESPAVIFGVPGASPDARSGRPRQEKFDPRVHIATQHLSDHGWAFAFVCIHEVGHPQGLTHSHITSPKININITDYHYRYNLSA